ncbi:HET domain-containing protein [Xylaria digitata]|nr:HET domain-containing protein [Xylaria digitata]
MSTHHLADPCHCRPWHKNCESTCSQAKFASGGAPAVSLRNFRISGERGCPTCAIITSGLVIPDIREIWRRSIEPALRGQRSGVVTELRNDEEEIRIELMEIGNGRRVLRTRASDNSVDWRHFNFWREGHSDNRNGGCKAFPELNYQPVERTDSERSMENLKDWIKICDENHTCCSRDDPVLPSRVVKVTEDRVRVVETQGRRGRYMTLSHRWGTNETFTLTESNMDMMTDRIPWDAIPKTYQESIQVTRLLGLEYIWIDSLCIIQDDGQDWKREAGKMKSVYGNSYLNIAATEALDSYGGLFMSGSLDTKYPAQRVPRDSKIQIRPQPDRTHAGFGSNYYHTAGHPLMQRGWVLQERVLSPRVVYYDADELKWECQADTDCQCGGMVVLSNFKLDYYRSLKHDGAPLPYEWMRISEKYSCLKFTYDSDRAVALAGLAEQGVQSGKGGKYLAGLWERNLAHQLCWQVSNIHLRPDPYIAPSWSWLSVFGRVHYSNRMDFTSVCLSVDIKITEASCTSKEGDIPTISGSIVGFLRLKGRGLKMRAEVADYGTQSSPPVYCLRREGDEPGFLVRADYTMSREDADAVKEIFLLFLGSLWPNENGFLILKSVSGDGPKFERLGFVWLEKGGEAKASERILAHCKAEDDIIVV